MEIAMKMMTETAQLAKDAKCYVIVTMDKDLIVKFTAHANAMELSFLQAQLQAFVTKMLIGDSVATFEKPERQANA